MYCTKADVKLSERAWTELLDKGEGVKDEDVTALILRAQRHIDMILRTRYKVPFDPVPLEIKDIAATLVKYYAYQDAIDGNLDLEIQQLYDTQMKVLQGLRIGELTLTLEEGKTTDEEPGVILTNRTEDDRIFPKAFLDDY